MTGDAPNPDMLGPISGGQRRVCTHQWWLDVGKYLVAEAVYIDRTYDEDPDNDIAIMDEAIRWVLET